MSPLQQFRSKHITCQIGSNGLDRVRVRSLVLFAKIEDVSKLNFYTISDWENPNKPYINRKLRLWAICKCRVLYIIRIIMQISSIHGTLLGLDHLTNHSCSPVDHWNTSGFWLHQLYPKNHFSGYKRKNENKLQCCFFPPRICFYYY